MAKSIAVKPKKRGRPATGRDPLLAFRSPPDLTEKIDAWIGRQPQPRPARSEAIRRLLAEALGKPVDAGSIAAEDLNASNDE
jgi:hypothetical protein